MGYFAINSLINHVFFIDVSLIMENTKTLIIGDSHPQKSINPEYLSQAKNISQTGEPLILTYWKLKKY